MTKVLQIDFPYTGPFGEEMAEMSRELAHSITEEPGFIWKIWTESSEANQGGGIYLFTDQPAAEAYLKKHAARLKEWGINEVNAKIFDINQELTQLTHGPTA
jgi:hypothetical protein